MQDKVAIAIGFLFLVLVVLGIGFNQITLEKRLQTDEQTVRVVITPTVIPSPTGTPVATPSTALRKPSITVAPTR